MVGPGARGLRASSTAGATVGRRARAARAALVRGARGRPRRAAAELLVPLVRDAVRAVDVAGAPDRRRPRVPRRGGGGVMQLDVFTLFPEWFDWFRAPAPRRATRSRTGHELACVELPRAHAAQRRPGRRHAVRRRRRDGAARRRRRGRAARPLRRRSRSSCARARRVIALTPGGRLLDDALVDELAAEPALTLLCGRYEGFDERDRRALRAATRSRSAATCSPAASWRRWCSATPCCASCRARSATPSRRWRSRSAPRSSGGPEYPHYTRPAE